MTNTTSVDVGAGFARPRFERGSHTVRNPAIGALKSSVEVRAIVLKSINRDVRRYKRRLYLHLAYLYLAKFLIQLSYFRKKTVMNLNSYLAKAFSWFGHINLPKGN